MHERQNKKQEEPNTKQPQPPRSLSSRRPTPTLTDENPLIRRGLD